MVEIVADVRPPDEPLQHLVTEPRRVDVSNVGDGVWLRPVDRAALCAARGLPDPGVTDEVFANLLLGAFSPDSLIRAGRLAPGAGRRLDIARRALVAARVLTRASAAGTARGGETAPTLARPVRRVGAAPKAAKSAAGYPDRGRGSKSGLSYLQVIKTPCR